MKLYIQVIRLIRQDKTKDQGLKECGPHSFEASEKK